LHIHPDIPPHIPPLGGIGGDVLFESDITSSILRIMYAIAYFYFQNDY